MTQGCPYCGRSVNTAGQCDTPGHNPPTVTFSESSFPQTLYEKNITLEEKISDLEQRIESLEWAVHKLKKGNYDQSS